MRQPGGFLRRPLQILLCTILLLRSCVVVASTGYLQYNKQKHVLQPATQTDEFIAVALLVAPDAVPTQHPSRQARFVPGTAWSPWSERLGGKYGASCSECIQQSCERQPIRHGCLGLAKPTITRILFAEPCSRHVSSGLSVRETKLSQWQEKGESQVLSGILSLP